MVTNNQEAKKVKLESKLMNIAKTFQSSIVVILDVSLERESVAFISCHDRRRWFSPDSDDGDEEPPVSLSKMAQSKTTRLVEDYIG